MSQITPVALRHALHQTPELMFEEFETTHLLLDAVSSIKGLTVYRPLETGLVVEYKVNEGDYLLFRADIDALPIKEETGVPFASTSDKMHACGHDVHSSILYGFIQKVVREKINQNIIFLFQPGEEGGGGAKQVIDSGILAKFPITSAFALHVTDDYSFGTVASTSGTLFAAAIELDVIVHGRQAHVAFPERGIHAMNAMRRFLDVTDEIIAGKDEPVLFGCGKITSGTVRNIIPALAKAECTIRALSVEALETIILQFKSTLKEIAKETGITFELVQNSPYYEVSVDNKLFEICRDNVGSTFNFIDCGYKMTAEDFGLFSRQYPSFMAWLGTSKGEHYGLHTPKFFPDDSAIELGVTLFSEIINAMMKQKK